MAPTLRDLAFVGCSVALGLFASTQTNQDLGPWAEPILEACGDSSIPPEEFVKQTGLVEYDPATSLVGSVVDVFVCFLTQFFHGVATSLPGGPIVGIGTFSVVAPILVLMTLEAGRRDAWLPVRSPLIFLLLSQAVGFCVVMPLLWVPSFILFGGRRGGIAKRRIQLSILAPLAYLFVAALAFGLPTDHPLWPTIAGVLGGPAITLSILPVWFLGGSAPDVKDTATARRSAELATMAYAFSGIVSLLVWLYIAAFLVIPEFGIDPKAIYEELWEKAPPTVKFMSIDLTVVWLTGILYVTYLKALAGVEAMMVSIMFGPGAGLAMVLAGLEVEMRDPRTLTIQSGASTTTDDRKDR